MNIESTLEPRYPAAPRIDPSARILVIDDSQTVTRAIHGALPPPAFSVDSVDHVLELPAYVRRTPPDLIVLDLNMPVLSDQHVSDFIRQIRQHDIPLLFYSSLPEAGLRAAAIRIGAAGWVSKQAPMSTLVIRAKRIISRRKRSLVR